MEAKPGVPEIHPEVMRSEERRGEGLLAAALAKLGSGGPQGGGAAFAGGIFASKAGIVALALVGSSVAAGIGILATKPESTTGLRAGRQGQAQSMFDLAEKRGESMAGLEGSGEEQGAASPNGASNSLDFLQQANRPGTPKDPASGDKVSDAAAAAPGAEKDSGVQAPDHGSAGPGAPAHKPVERPAMVKGEGLAGRSGGSSSLQLSAQAGLSDGIGGGFQQMYRPPSRQTAGMEGSVRATAQASHRSALAKGGLASKQAADTMRMTNLAKGSRSAASAARYGGATYDGTGGSGNQIGGTAAPPGSAGAGTGEKAGDGVVNPNTAENLRQVPEPPSAKERSEDKTPYQHLVTRAMIGMAVAGLALFAACAASKKSKELAAANNHPAAASMATLAKALAGIATVAAVLVAATGIQMTQKPNGQMGQGMMFALIGGILAFQAGMVLINDEAGKEAEAKTKASAEEFGKTADANLKVTKMDGMTAHYSNGKTATFTAGKDGAAGSWSWNK